MLLDKFKSLSEIFMNIDRRIGFKKFVQYTIFIIVMLGVYNFKIVIKDALEIYDEISKDNHLKKLAIRDELMGELKPILAELRAETNADRILYFEYHNSKENLIGIPFKYVDLSLPPIQKYGIPEFDISKYKDINAGILTDLYRDIKEYNVIINKGPNDFNFTSKYSDVSKYVLSRDGSVQQCFINVPGISIPMGLIIIEWISIEDRNWIDIKSTALDFIPRINGLILSKT